MLKYCIKRLLLSVFILLGVSLLIYFLVRLMPMDFITNKIQSQGITDESLIEAAKKAYGLDDNSFTGILKGYWTWLVNFMKGDMGTSWLYLDEVENVIAQNMGVSFFLSFVSLILQLAIAIPLGIKCACNQYGKLDYTATVLAMVGMSFPSFFFGSLLIKIFAEQLGWFPINGLVTSTLPKDATWLETTLDMGWHLVLPLAVLVILSIGSMMRYTRTNTLEVLNADYIRTARAKGLSESTVVYKHVFRNTMIPLVTTLAGVLPGLFGGAMITEQLFAIEGIGKKAYDALMVGDIPFIMSYNMFIAILTVAGIWLTDILYAAVDPRVKLGK